MRVFDPSELKNLYKRSELPENGEITIIGGSDLFHGAPILSVKAASRVVDMVYFSSPEPSFSQLSLQLKSELSSFVWVPWEEVSSYIKKSDAVLIGPGMKRYRKEKETPYYAKAARAEVVEYDQDGTQTKFIVENLLRQFSDKRWVIDAGALQVMDPKYIPEGAVLTPNKNEYGILFGEEKPEDVVRKYKCVLVVKGPVAYVYTSRETVEVRGGNNGLTKGGTGDVLAGVAVALIAKNEPFLAAASAACVVKRAGDELYKKAGTVYNADDLAEKVSQILGEYLR